MKNSYEIRARKFAEAIAEYFEGCKRLGDYEWAVRAFNRDTGRKVECCSGATRIALITSDYVVKFNYSPDVESWGGCEEEAACYEEAEAEGVEGAFCPIKHLFDRYYVMPRAVCRYSDCGMKHFWEGLSWCEENFINEHIRDIHNGNIGRYCGRMVLIDYACNEFE